MLILVMVPKRCPMGVAEGAWPVGVAWAFRQKNPIDQPVLVRFSQNFDVLILVMVPKRCLMGVVEEAWPVGVARAFRLKSPIIWPFLVRFCSNFDIMFLGWYQIGLLVAV